MPELLYLFLAGIVGGFISGFLGVGGGIIYIVVLPIALKEYIGIEDGKLAAMIVANSFLGICFASISSVLTHLKERTFYLRETGLVAVSALIVAVFAQQFILKGARYDYFTYNLFVIIILIGVLCYYLLSHLKNENGVKQERINLSILKLSLSGVFSGLVSVFTGLGGAITLIPLLKYWLNIDVKRSRSISIGMIFLVSLFISISNIWSVDFCEQCIGLISWQVSLPLILGVTFSSVIGVKISNRLSKKFVETTFILFLILVLLQKIILLIKSLD